MFAFAPVAATTLHFGLVELLIASAWCLGFWNVFNEGMILHSVDRWAAGYEKKLENPNGKKWTETIPGHLPAWLYKPLMGCVICMASIHGSFFYVVFIGLDWQLLLFVVCLSGLNFFAVQFFTE